MVAPLEDRKKLDFGRDWPTVFGGAIGKNGVGGLVCSQIIPFGDAKVMGLWFDIEAQVYQALGREAS